MGKVKDIINTEHIGKVISTYNKRFGNGTYLIIKENYSNWVDMIRFVRLPSAHVLYWDSMKNDEVLNILTLPKISECKIKTGASNEKDIS